MANEKRHLWGSHSFWLCDMATTYKILYYTEPVHTLRRWYQEILAYAFAFIHQSYKMIINVDYLSRIHNGLVRQHVIIANALSFADRSARPCAYKVLTWTNALSRGKYSIKGSQNTTFNVNTHRISNEPVHSCSLITPFAIISTDIWCPGNTVSLTGIKYILNCMCDMTQFVVPTALAHITSSDLAKAFMENVLLKFGIYIVLVVDGGSTFMGIFIHMAKALNIRL